MFWDQHKTLNACEQHVEYLNIKPGGTQRNR